MTFNVKLFLAIVFLLFCILVSTLTAFVATRIITISDSDQLLVNTDESQMPFLNEMKVVKYTNNPILETQENIDGLSLAAGNCLVDSDDEIVLFYYSHSDKGLTIFSSRSSNGTDFSSNSDEPSLEPGEMGSWDDGGVSIFPNCIVQIQDGTYLMYYTGHKLGSDIYHSGQIGIATSTDLVNWTKSSSNPIISPSRSGWDSWAVFEPSVIYSWNNFGKPDAYRMWYGGSNTNLRFEIGYAYSDDGIEWTKHTGNPVISYSNTDLDFDGYSIEVHSVTKMGNGYVLLYEAVQNEFPSPFSVGLAYSRDGIAWKKSSLNPILEAGGVGSWDQMGAYHPALFLADDGYRIYYVGLDHAYAHRIGFAHLNPNLIWELQEELSR